MSRYWVYEPNLIPGATARSESVEAQFSNVDQALSQVEGEMNLAIRLTGATAVKATYEIPQTPAQRINKLLGFDGSGNLGLSNAGFGWKGPWATGIAYVTNDVVMADVSHSYSIYVCRAGHTSGTFDNDLAAGLWELMIDLTLSRQALILHSLIVGPNSVTLAAGQDVMVDVTNGAVTLTLPNNPSITDQPINIMHVGGNVQDHPIVVAGNGKRIMGLLETMTVDTPNASFGLAFCNDNLGWRIRGV